VQKIVLLDEELAPVNPQYGGELTVKDVLMAQMSNVKSSVRALRYVEGTWEQRLKAYRELLEENEEYLLNGLHEKPREDEDMPF
jgi:hypothetical protein